MTSFENKCQMLSELWLNYRNNPGFKDFIEYNDLGLPLAHFVASKIVESNERVEMFISETFDLLLAGLELEDTGFESLDDLLNADSPEDND